jgi:hypothetical protein
MADDPERTGLRRIMERRRALNLAAAALLALAAVATAWTTYQSARWAGLERQNDSEANLALGSAVEASLRGTNEVLIRNDLFEEWRRELEDGETEVANELFSGFPEDMQGLILDWEATEGGVPPSIHLLEGLAIPRAAEIEDEVGAAEAAYENARTNNERSDNYIFLGVVFALVMFFAGISGKTPSVVANWALLAAGVVAFAGGVIVLATFPVH